MELNDSNQVDMLGPNYEKKNQTNYRFQKWFAYEVSLQIDI